MPAPHPIPICPSCQLPVWREGHLAEQRFEEPQRPDVVVECTVCMHCSSIWTLVYGKCVKPSDAEMADMLPHLGPIAERFRRNRRLSTVPFIVIIGRGK